MSLTHRTVILQGNRWSCPGHGVCTYMNLPTNIMGHSVGRDSAASVQSVWSGTSLGIPPCKGCTRRPPPPGLPAKQGNSRAEWHAGRVHFLLQRTVSIVTTVAATDKKEADTTPPRGAHQCNGSRCVSRSCTVSVCKYSCLGAMQDLACVLNASARW